MSTYAKLKSMTTAIVCAICRKTKSPEFAYTIDDEPFMRINGLHAEDEGRMIGKNGNTFWAFTVAHMYGCDALGLAQVRIRPIDTRPKKTTGVVAFRSLEQWDKEAVTKMIEAILSTCLPGKAAWVLDEAHGVVVRIRIDKSLEKACSDPSIAEMLDVLIHCAGKSCGASIKTEVTWA